MKKIALMMLAGMITSLTFAQKMQDKDVPVIVKNAFQKQYPNARDVEWEKKNGNYEVEFELNKVENSVVYNESGNILETEIEIGLKQLPVGVMAYLKKNYAGKKAKEAAMITNSDGVVTYEVEIKNKDLIFDSNGNFVKEETEDLKDNDH